MFSLISPRGFRRADSDGSSSHFQHHVSQAPPNGSPTNQRSQSFESERRGPAPQPLPRRSLVRSLKKSLTPTTINKYSNTVLTVVLRYLYFEWFKLLFSFTSQTINFKLCVYLFNLNHEILIIITDLNWLCLSWVSFCVCVNHLCPSASWFDQSSGWGSVRLPGRPPRWAELLWGTGAGGPGAGGQRLVGTYHHPMLWLVHAWGGGERVLQMIVCTGLFMLTKPFISSR